MFWHKSPVKGLQSKMEAAESYQQWAEHAAVYDWETGLDDWRSTEPSSQYDYRSVRKRFELLRGLRYRHDYPGLMFALNEGIHGNLAGMGKAALYSQAKLGTKHLIHQYTEEVCQALRTIDELDDSVIPLAERKDFFLRTSHCFGRSALMLSGGAVLGFFHIGVLKALFQENLLPSIISGSSAGSIMAAIVATHTDDKLLEQMRPEHLEIVEALEPEALQRRNPPDAKVLRQYLERVIPDLTFEEAYRLTGRKLNITVTGLLPRQAPRLLNAITAPNVLIRSAILASCALYGIYPPVTLQAKNAAGEQVPYLPELQWIDGSFIDDLPAKRLGRLYGVNHFISSLTNPAALFFTPDPDTRHGLLQSALNYQVKLSKNVATHLLKLSRDHLRLRNPTLSRWQHLGYNVLAQDYTADINIFLGKRWHSPLKLLSPLPLAEMEQLIREGEQATWERMEMIRNCTAISRTLDRILMDHGWAD
ncbi:DUF3336 domain-containing protein [Pseudomonas cavernae]|uniref:DUF3336 domain-containing protein n=1 Tax=Pseudomonas cavernae TaxID=2320867 RepID=A0A385Z1P6_9PSED|nr:patatin-like phospholipase family protein [Pseudomonas cavernae]AYC33145.1 DUF3336 domain-containing protein [Pseudomonas cavernae]